MPIIFIRYILPVLVVVAVQIKLSYMENKWFGLIIPAICISLTIIFSVNAFELLGVLFAWTIMLLPNVLSIGLYIATRRYKNKRDAEIIRLKFKKK
ncbi:MAG: hypothetical protein R3Y09_04415 [Clostridia bacterium]